MLFPARGAKGDVGAGVVAAGEGGDTAAGGVVDGGKEGATGLEPGSVEGIGADSAGLVSWG